MTVFCVVNPAKRSNGENAKAIDYTDDAPSSVPISHDQLPVPEYIQFTLQS